MTKYIPIDENALRHLYVVERLTTSQIAEQLGVTSATIKNRLKRYGIPARSNLEAHCPNARLLSEEELRRMYLDKQMTSKEIAHLCGVDPSTVTGWLRRYDISRRSYSETMLARVYKPSEAEMRVMYCEQGLPIWQIASKCNASRDRVSRWMQEYSIPTRLSIAQLRTHQQPPKEELYRLYCNEFSSLTAIAKLYEVDRGTVRKWFRAYEIPVRKGQDTRFKNRQLPSKLQLVELYQEQGRSAAAIAPEFGVTSGTIINLLRSYQIPVRRGGETRIKGRGGRKPTQLELTALYLDNGLSTKTIAKMFNIDSTTVREQLKLYGINPRLSGLHGQFVCEDGHLVRSGLERAVDDWLFKSGIPHAYEPKLPFGGRADFLIGETYLEVWGLSSSFAPRSELTKKYARRRAKKELLYRQHNLIHVGIETGDIPYRLGEKLAIFLT